jgi:hypothetical protein
MIKGRDYDRLMVPMSERTKYDKELAEIRAQELKKANGEFAKRQMDLIDMYGPKGILKGDGVKLEARE